MIECTFIVIVIQAFRAISFNYKADVVIYEH